MTSAATWIQVRETSNSRLPVCGSCVAGWPSVRSRFRQATFLPVDLIGRARCYGSRVPDSRSPRALQWKPVAGSVLSTSGHDVSSSVRVTVTAHATLQSGESAERGRAARRDTPRSAHGEWAPAPDRPDPVAVLEAQAASRVQELVPIRYGRMLVSPFTFYRGAAAVMAADLAATPDSGIVVQACGDAHISNFGGFAAQDRRLVFGPNDFDETLPGPWEWDVKRMAASVEIAGRDVGLPADRRQRIVTDLRARVPRGDARLRGREPPRRLVRPPQRERAGRSLRREAGQEGADRVREAVRQGAAQDEPAGGQEAHRAGRRRAALPQRPAAAGSAP